MHHAPTDYRYARARRGTGADPAHDTSSLVSLPGVCRSAPKSDGTPANFFDFQQFARIRQLHLAHYVVPGEQPMVMTKMAMPSEVFGVRDPHAYQFPGELPVGPAMAELHVERHRRIGGCTPFRGASFARLNLGSCDSWKGGALRSERSTIAIQAILGEHIVHGSGLIKMVRGFRGTKALARALQHRGRDQRTHRH